MNNIQEFAINNIYCSPSEDRQFRFTLIRATKPLFPVMRGVSLFDRTIVELPTKNDQYHVYLIGGIPPYMLNLYKNPGKSTCGRTGWTNVADDMNERDYIFQVYDDDGVTIPRHLIYYKLNKNNNLIIAIKLNGSVRRNLDIEKAKYLRVYSNPYFGRLTTGDYIKLVSTYATNRDEVVKLQREFDQFNNKRGKVVYYINGYLTRVITPDLAVGKFIEILYDTSIKTIEEFPIRGLRTFMSMKDKRLKYLLHRRRSVDYIEFFDDAEVYISSTDKRGVEEAVYYYQNRMEAFRNVSDKDYAADSRFVNNQADFLARRHGIDSTDRKIILLTRHQAFKRSLVYSAMKLHELYKLPFDVEYNVMSNRGNTIVDFRAETLEDSDYFKVVGLTDLGNLTPELAMGAIGYASAVRYYGNTPEPVVGNIHDLPPLYRYGCLGYEYDDRGIMTDWHSTREGVYSIHKESTTHVEFIQGLPTNDFTLYTKGDVITIDPKREFVIIGALHEDRKRLAEWEDKTNSPDLIYKDNTITIEGNAFIHYRLCYLDDPYVFHIDYSIKKYFDVIRLLVHEKYRDDLMTRPIDRYYDTVEVFVNGRRLVEGIDFFMDFPNIVICNKEYLQYSNKGVEQRIHIRCTGFALKKEEINRRELKGYMHHGVLGRNGLYDIRDDKVFTAYIDGKMYPRDKIRYAEEDGVIRTDDELNGFPFLLADRKLSIRILSDLPTEPYYKLSEEKNERIGRLFSDALPEPKIESFNVLRERHFLFSPTLSRIIRDVVYGVIPSSLYTNQYQDLTIRELIEKDYKHLIQLDPIDKDLPEDKIVIHPDYGNAPITVNVFQYRFISNVVRILTGGNKDRIDLSTYLIINREVDELDPKDVFDPKGPTCTDCEKED